MANTDSWLKKDMMIAGAYDEYKPDRWETEYIDDIYKKLKEPAGDDPAEVFKQLELPLDLARGLKIRKGDQLPDGSVYPTPVISGEDGIDEGIGPTKEEAEFIRKYLGDLPLQANINNPRMDILLPFAVEDDSKYGEPEGTPEEIEELKRRGWASRPNKKSMTIAGDTSFTIGGGQSSRKNKAIMKNADVNTPNATKFMDKLKLGPSMFPVKKAHNYIPGPATDGIKDIIIQRSNELMKIGERDKALELMKIVPGLLQKL